MRKPFLIIIWSVAAVCAVVGIILHVFPGTGISSGVRSIDTGSFNSGGQYVETDDFSALDINCGTASITVQRGEKYSVEINAKNPSKAKHMPVWKIEDDTLMVYQENKNFISLGSLNDTTYYVNVTVPDTEDEMLKKINIDIGSGTAALNGISTERLNIDSGTGTLSLDRINADQLEIDTGTGKVEISDCRVSDLEIESGTGSSTIALLSAADRIKIDNGTGTVNMTLPGTERDYDMDFDIGTGSVTVAGEKHHGDYRSKGLGERTIKIDSGTGNVNISFTEEAISE